MNQITLEKQWTTVAGLDGYIMKMDLGFLCGYVALPENHRLYEVDYEDLDTIDVHGGITYSGYSQLENQKFTESSTQVDDNTWWIGFDCSHGYDLVPGMQHIVNSGNRVYRDIDYVTNEVEELAAKLQQTPRPPSSMIDRVLDT